MTEIVSDEQKTFNLWSEFSPKYFVPSSEMQTQPCSSQRVDKNIRYPWSVINQFSNKTVLITGVTGFVGKVLLEKLLREVRDITIILLIRGDVEKRWTQIIESELFSVLRKREGDDFHNFISKRCIPVSGDTKMNNVGLSIENQELLSDKVNIVLHCAATTDFRTTFREALDVNVLGSIRLFKMAKKFRNIECFTYVSTTYCQPSAGGIFREELTKLCFNPEELLKELELLSNEDLLIHTAEITKGFCNPYAVSKAMAEHCLFNLRGNLPFCIVRPTIVGTTIAEPFPGWTDSSGAFGGVILVAALNVLPILKCQPEVVGDLIPVDTVSNVIIAATAAQIADPKFKIYHVGSGSTCPLTWFAAQPWVNEYWQKQPSNQKVVKGETNITLISPSKYEAAFKRKFGIPLSLLSWGGIVSPNLKKMSMRMEKLSKKCRQVGELFSPYTTNQWYFDCSNSLELMRNLSEEDSERFVYRVPRSTAQWKKYILEHCWGIHRFILKENVPIPAWDSITARL